MSKKPIAIIFSDLHIHKWKRYNEDNKRLKHDLSVIDYLGFLAKKYKVPILFEGDLFEDPKNLSNEVINYALSGYKKFIEGRSVKFYAISGNHDMSQNNTFQKRSPSYLHAFDEMFKTFNLMDFKSFECENFNLYGVPYLKGNKDFEEAINSFKIIPNGKKNILNIHTDLPGALDTDGREVGTAYNIPQNLRKFFKKFDLVLSGHIHAPQVISKGKVFMIGSPKHQNISDMGCDMGYWILTEDFKMIFKKLDQFPKFKPLGWNDELPDDFNYYVRIPEEDGMSVEVSKKEFSNQLDRVTLAKRYCKTTGIKSKVKKQTLLRILKKSYE